MTMTEFRKDLFKLVEKVPEGRLSKLDRLTQRQISNPGMSDEEQQAAERTMRTEMLAEIENDWADLK